MTVVHRALLDTLDVVARGLQVAARADATNTTSSGSTPTVSVTSSSTSPVDTATVTPTPNPNTGSGSQSPLLFFVALGFGVVFTNLWIIVGVKYCFRYNARNRAIARGENPDELPLDNIAPGRPHRRRREKKLMSMDEVNERFPLTKYKAWTTARAQNGLPAEGGVAAGAVTAPSSRAGSLRNVEGVVPSSPSGSKHSVDRPDTAVSVGAQVAGTAPRRSIDSDKQPHVSEHKTNMPTLTEVKTTQTSDEAFGKETRASQDEESDDDVAHIHDALPVDVLEHPGDTCAICIDTLEADDDVRGLTCGHAFHAGCLDPWLTSRRACCPLCKADYYVPKPKPEGADAAAEGESSGRRRRAVQPPPPVHGQWAGFRGPRFMPRPIRSPWSPREMPTAQQGTQPGRSERNRRVAEARANAVASAGANNNTAQDSSPATGTPAEGGMRRFMRMPFRRQGTDAPAAGEGPTPQQLEAGSPAVR